MERIVFYQKITKDKLDQFRKLLNTWKSDVGLADHRDWILRMCDKLCLDSYFIMDSLAEINKYDLNSSVVTEVKSMSIWKSKPYTYSGMQKVLTCEGIPMYFMIKDFHLSCAISDLQILFKNSNSNSQSNGKDQNRLQEQAVDGSGSSEGCILYGRRNVPKYSAGRHCDQARAQENRARTSGPQVILSTRRPEILGAQRQGGGSEAGTRTHCSSSEGARISDERYGTIIGIHNGIQVRYLSSRSECLGIGDSYKANDEIIRVLTSIDEAGVKHFTPLTQM